MERSVMIIDPQWSVRPQQADMRNRILVIVGSLDESPASEEEYKRISTDVCARATSYAMLLLNSSTLDEVVAAYVQELALGHYDHVEVYGGILEQPFKTILEAATLYEVPVTYPENDHLAVV